MHNMHPGYAERGQCAHVHIGNRTIATDILYYYSSLFKGRSGTTNQRPNARLRWTSYYVCDRL